MALTDILFDTGDAQEMLLELPAGTLGTPNDIVFESDTTKPVEEIDGVQMSSSYVF
jgi:hypothetical protein